MVSPARVVIATPIEDRWVELIRTRAPRAEVVHLPDLMPRMRFPGDYAGDPTFRRTPQEQSTFDAALDRATVLLGIPDLDPAALRAVVDRNPRLHWVHTMAAGGGAQLRAAALDEEQLRRVRVTTSAGVHGGPLAEFALLGLLAGIKQLPKLQADQHHRRWPERRPVPELSGSTVIVLGSGGIARTVQERLTALGVRVLLTTRDRTKKTADRILLDDVPAALAQVRGLVCALPGTDATHHLVDDDFLRAARGLVLVNVGRGSVVSESSLLRAIDAGRVGFAALDVTEVEPLPASSALWGRAEVLLSPHTAALSTEEERRIAELFADNLNRFIDGRPLRNLVDTVEFY